MVEFPRRRWPFFAISALGLAIGLWGMSGLLSLSALPPGYPANPILPQLTRLHLWIILLEGLIFLAVNVIVFAPRTDRGPLRDLYWCTLLYGIATMIHGLYFPRSRAWMEWVFPAIRIACLTALPVFFFRMTQTFPRSRRLLETRPRLMRGLWIAAGVLFLWQVAATFRYFADPRPGVWQGMALPRLLADAFLAAAIGVGCITLFRSGRKLELARERDQIKWLLWGFAVGVLPYVFLRALPRLLRITTSIPPELDRLFELAIPVAATFAVVRSRLLDIDIIIRRSLIYGILGGALTGIYLLVGVVAGERIATSAPKYSGLFQIFAAALPVILYTPARRWIGAWVDRTFFKIQHDYAGALLVFQDTVRAGASQEEIAELCRHFLEEQLSVQRAVVVARRGGTLAVSGGLADADPESILEAVEGSPAPRRLLARPHSTSRPDLETDSFPANVAAEDFRLALAIWAGEKCLGAILVGAKQSERRFIEEDLKLLHAVRAQAASALERVELVQIAAKEAFFHENAEDLEGQKNLLFATLADDLRRPLTVVRWTIETLLERMGHASSTQHLAELQAIQAASSELDRLVKHLHGLNRPGSGGPRDPERIDLLPLVQEAMAAVTPEAKTRRVRLELSVAPDLTPVKGYRDLLLDAVINLIENAVHHSPDGQAVEIALDRKGGEDRVSVRDHGPGIPAIRDIGGLFDRLEDGGFPPGDRGFGLGLYIAQSYLEHMRGRVQAENHPEGGARFVCAIPEWRSADRGVHAGIAG